MISRTLFLLLTSLILAVGPARAAVVDRIAAVVNDEVITLSDVYELGAEFIETRAEQAEGSNQARRQAELEVLDSLIMRRLISQEIEELELDVTDQELDRTIDDIARRNNLDREQLRAEVERSGLPWHQYRQEMRENLRQAKFSQAVIQPRINVNEDELLDAYRRATADSELPVVADLGAVFLPYGPEPTDETKAQVLDKAKALRASFVPGETDFAAFSAEHDQGPYGASGGKMGTYKQGELMAGLDEPAFATETGQLSEPVLMPQGVFLLYVFDRRAQEAPSFEEMREPLLNQVYADRIDDETDQWYRQARRRAAVLVKLASPDQL